MEETTVRQPGNPEGPSARVYTKDGVCYFECTCGMTGSSTSSGATLAEKEKASFDNIVDLLADHWTNGSRHKA